MRKLIIGKDSSRIYYSAVVNVATIGQMNDTRSNLAYPAIGLYYPANQIEAALKIARETEKQHTPPRVHIVESDRSSELMVIFEIKNVTMEFLQDLLGEKFPSKLRPDCSLIMTGEAEFPWGTTKPFHEQFRTLGHYGLWLMSSRKEPLWGVMLTELSSEFPQIT